MESCLLRCVLCMRKPPRTVWQRYLLRVFVYFAPNALGKRRAPSLACFGFIPAAEPGQPRSKYAAMPINRLADFLPEMCHGLFKVPPDPYTVPPNSACTTPGREPTKYPPSICDYKSAESSILPAKTHAFLRKRHAVIRAIQNQSPSCHSLPAISARNLGSFPLSIASSRRFARSSLSL